MSGVAPWSRLWRAPLFVQLFGAILGAVLLVQVATAALLAALPMPAGELFSATAVAQVLRTGRDPAGAFVVERWRDLPPGPRLPSDLELAARFARLLGKPAANIRARTEGPAERDIGAAFRRSTTASPGGGRAAIAPDDVLFAGFLLAARQPDGSWRSVRPAHRFLDPLWVHVLAVMVAAVAATMAVAWVAVRRIVRPIRDYAAAAERLGADPTGEHVALDGPGELGEAARAFNAMRARIQCYMAERATMLAAIAHDLRTPLMRIAMRLDGAPPDDREAIETNIREMDARLKAAAAFVRDLAVKPELQRVDLRSIAESVVADAQDAGLQAALVDGPAVKVRGDRAALKSVVANLVENACRYAGGAEVAVDAREGRGWLTVADRGPGMAEADLARAFEPFFRAERSRDPDSGGLGLGLASVMAVMRAHGGASALRAREGGGLIASAELPLAAG